MPTPQSLQLRVGVDVGTRCHSVAVGLTDGRLLEQFLMFEVDSGEEKACLGGGSL